MSPVFFSTSPSGDVMQGLAGLNLKPGRPVLLVGNHQTIPVDIAPLVEGVRTLTPLHCSSNTCMTIMHVHMMAWLPIPAPSPPLFPVC